MIFIVKFAKLVKIIENYNRAKQKYGVSVAQLMLSKGIPSKYVFLACKYHVEDKIHIEMLQLRFHQWILYIRNKGKENFDVTEGRFFCHIEHLKRAGPRDALSRIFMMFTQQIWYTSVSIHIERYDQD